MAMEWNLGLRGFGVGVGGVLKTKIAWNDTEGQDRIINGSLAQGT